MRHKKRWLITIDLDGTLLKNSINYPDFDFNKWNMIVLKELIKQGHMVAIVTGRPWRDSKQIYEAMGLNTIIANFNGSLIHHPKDKGFVPVSTTINRKIISEMLRKTSLKLCFKNVLLEFEHHSEVYDSNDQEMMKQFHITNYQNIKQIESIKNIKMNPHSVHIRIHEKNMNKWDLFTELKRKYGYAIQFRLFWSHKNKDEIYLELNQLSTNKSSAMKYIASYYNIPLSNTIAFGDGLNDVEMLSTANHGVAMKNAKGTVKTYAKDVTDYSNDNAGVGKYLEEFFNLDIN